MSHISTYVTRAEQEQEAALQYVETDLGREVDRLNRVYDDLYGKTVGQSWTIPYGMSAAELEEAQQRIALAVTTLARLRDGFNPIREMG